MSNITEIENDLKEKWENNIKPKLQLYQSKEELINAVNIGRELFGYNLNIGYGIDARFLYRLTEEIIPQKLTSFFVGLIRGNEKYLSGSTSVLLYAIKELNKNLN